MSQHLRLVLVIAVFACASMAASGQDRPPLDSRLVPLRQQLADASWATQLRAVSKIKELGADATPLLPDLCRVAATPNLKTRQTVAEAIEAVDKGFYDALLPILVDDNSRVRTQAILELPSSEHGPAAVSLIVWLARQNGLAIAKSDDDGVSQGIRIGEIRTCLNVAVRLNHSDSGVVKLVQEAASGTLKGADGLVLDALPLLPDLNRDSKPSLNRSVSILSAATKSKNQRLSVAAIVTLKRFGPDAKAALPALRAAKLSSTAAVREAAGAAIESVER